jgi:hypothetical protein
LILQEWKKHSKFNLKKKIIQPNYYKSHYQKRRSIYFYILFKFLILLFKAVNILKRNYFSFSLIFNNTIIKNIIKSLIFFNK